MSRRASRDLNVVSRASNRSWQKPRKGSILQSVSSPRHRKSGALAARVNTTNGRTPYILTLAVAAVTALAVLLVQPYSVPSPWQSYVQPARQYLQAALRGDSAA